MIVSEIAKKLLEGVHRSNTVTNFFTITNLTFSEAEMKIIKAFEEDGLINVAYTSVRDIENRRPLIFISKDAATILRLRKISEDDTGKDVS